MSEHSPTARATDRPDPAGPGLRLRQDRPRGPRPRPARRRRRRWSPPAAPPRGSQALGLPVTKVEDLTGFPECLDGRVKTLHPKVHAGILADRRLESHVAAARGARRRAVRPGRLQPLPVHRRPSPPAPTPDECVEQIDIGGPSMVRAAAKNHPSVAIVTSPDAVRRRAGRRRRRRLHPRAAAAAGRRGVRAHRDVRRRRGVLDGQRAHRHLRGHRLPGLGRARPGTRRRCCATARTRTSRPRSTATASARRAWPRPSSCTARRCPTTTTSTPTRPAGRRYDFDEPAVAIIKHANPCGIAVGADVAEAHRKAHACDPVSAFGGVIAANRPVTVAMAEQVAEVFTEVVVAPGVRGRRGRGAARARRTSGSCVCAADRHRDAGRDPRRSPAALLHAAASTTSTPPATTRRPGRWPPARPPPTSVLADLAFAWQACRAVKSNAILLAHDGASVGVGMGQVNRVDSCRLAVERAGERAAGSVAASDAFFPFADGPQVLIDAGVRAIVQPGGSMRDERGRRGARGGRRDDVLHRHPALLPPDPDRRRRARDRAARRLGARRADHRGAARPPA